MVDDGSDEIGGFEDFEVAFGCVMTLGAVDDGLGGGVPGDFLEGEGMAQEIFGETPAAFAGEGEEAFVTAIGAMEAEEAGGEVAAAEEVADGGEDVGAERAEGGAVFFLVGCEEGFPSGGEELPKW